MPEPLYQSDPYLKTTQTRISAIDELGVQLDCSHFYPTGGGQPGDTGWLVLRDGSRLEISDTRKGEAAQHHLLATGLDALNVGDVVGLELDWPRRYAHMRMHTCLHLLSAVIKAPVTGGRIGAEKAHLDFDVDMALLDKDTIEEALNKLIAAETDVVADWITEAQLDAQPELVKTLSVQPPRGAGRIRLINVPGVDLQPCGGTHVLNTKEIGQVVVSRIRSEGRQNKRVTIAFKTPS